MRYVVRGDSIEITLISTRSPGEFCLNILAIVEWFATFEDFLLCLDKFGKSVRLINIILESDFFTF